MSCAGTYIHVWSINGSPIASANTFTGRSQQILCCCVSEMNEWDTQNVIVTGHSDGVVRVTAASPGPAGSVVDSLKWDQRGTSVVEASSVFFQTFSCSFGEWSSSKSQKPRRQSRRSQMCRTAAARRRSVSCQKRTARISSHVTVCVKRSLWLSQRAPRITTARTTAASRTQTIPARCRSPKLHATRPRAEAASRAAPCTRPEVLHPADAQRVRGAD